MKDIEATPNLKFPCKLGNQSASSADTLHWRSDMYLSTLYRLKLQNCRNSHVLTLKYEKLFFLPWTQNRCDVTSVSEAKRTSATEKIHKSITLLWIWIWFVIIVKWWTKSYEGKVMQLEPVMLCRMTEHCKCFGETYYLHPQCMKVSSSSKTLVTLPQTMWCHIPHSYLPGGKGWPAHKTDNVTVAYEPIV
jgi:hypothetical protein